MVNNSQSTNIYKLQKSLFTVFLVAGSCSIALNILSLLATYHLIVVSPLAYYAFTAGGVGSGIIAFGSLLYIIYIAPKQTSQTPKSYYAD